MQKGMIMSLELVTVLPWNERLERIVDCIKLIQLLIRLKQEIAHDYLPPTSVIIQSGIARLTIAKTSAAMNNVPDITVSLSIAAIKKTMFWNDNYLMVH